MIPWVLFAILSLILLSTHTYKEPINATLPVSFPRSDAMRLPNPGNVELKGPALIGINGSGTDLTYLEINQSQIGFNSSGYDRSHDAILYANSSGLNIKAKSVALQADSTAGATNATSGNFGSLKVNRSDGDLYPGWGPGIHTTDVYVNASLGVGQDANVAAWMYSSGEMGCNGTATLPNLSCDTMRIQNNHVVDYINSLRGGIEQLNRDIDNRNRKRWEEQMRRAAEEAAAAIRRAADAAANAARNAGNSVRRFFRW